MLEVLQKSLLFARLGRWVFPRRLLVGLPVVVLASLLVRPRDLFGHYQALGLSLSALITLAGISLRVWAGGCAGDHTRTGEIQAPRLVTAGPYAHVRNPIYLGTAILGLGMVGLIGDPWMLALHLPAFVMLYALIVPAEEQFLRRRFGAEYKQYCQAVPRVVPRMTPWEGRQSRAFNWAVLRGEAWIVLYIGGIYAALTVAAHLRG